MTSGGLRHIRTTTEQGRVSGEGLRRGGRPLVGGLVAVAAVASVAVSAPAGAVAAEAASLGAGSFTDPMGDGTDAYNAGTGDVVSGKVTHTSRVVTASYTLAGVGGFPNGVYWQFDTVAGDPGPEFLAGWTYDAPGSAYVVRVKDFGGWVRRG